MSKLAKRTIVGSVLGLIVAVVLFLHPLAVFIISLIWIALATNEFLRLLQAKQIYINRFLMIGLNLLFPIIFYFWGYREYYLVLVAVLMLYGLIKQQTQSADETKRNQQYYLIVPFGIFTLFYLGFLPTHLLFLKVWCWGLSVTRWLSFFIVFFPVVFTWINDTTAYLVGSLIGRHKLASKISPNKTIEGFIGSVIIAVVFSFLYLRALFPHIAIWLPMVIGFALSVAAQLGDLVESGFKRDAYLKNSSNALGEHGGFLDRVDSLLFTIPVFYYILIYIIT